MSTENGSGKSQLIPEQGYFEKERQLHVQPNPSFSFSWQL